ncbi:retinol dehydrogenase 7-like [Protobothrops mucrosquamatus]|uniref:retinol dehydrogenase 7-like n=1 Tax=Protobothrops mucrosquamatus TaxID=103944 RepID=UPI0010FAEA36|nr:retinol dehydrogenase 7-like [Protobothrops mucrosquamatus]
MWLYLVALVGLYILCQLYREKQIVENLTEKYVFITGCDSGFGNQLARQLDAQGLRVLAACLTPEGAEQLEKVASVCLKTILLDVTNTESVAAATDWVEEQVGDKGLWGLVNNAGVAFPLAPNQWLTKDDFAKVLNVNLLGVVDVTLHLLPLIRRARGRVVNVSSLAGRIACGGGGYSPSKFALEAFSDSLRREMHPFGVKVSIIEPGAFLTGLDKCAAEFYSTLWSNVPPDIKELYGQEFWRNFNQTFVGKRWKKKNLHIVTDCMEHALISAYPHSRYAAGRDIKFFFIPLSYLPTLLTDYILTYGQPRPAKSLLSEAAVSWTAIATELFAKQLAEFSHQLQAMHSDPVKTQTANCHI